MDPGPELPRRPSLLPFQTSPASPVNTPADRAASQIPPREAIRARHTPVPGAAFEPSSRSSPAIVKNLRRLFESSSARRNTTGTPCPARCWYSRWSRFDQPIFTLSRCRNRGFGVRLIPPGFRGRLGATFLEGLLEAKGERSAVRRLAFPDNERPPTERPQCAHHFLVAIDVRAELLGPERQIALGRVCESASGVSMPEAAVNEDSSPMTSQDNIWPAG